MHAGRGLGSGLTVSKHGIPSLAFLIRGVPHGNVRGAVVLLEGAGHRQSHVAFSQLLCLSAINACRRASAAQVGVTSGVRAATMMLVVHVLPPADGANNCLFIFVAVLGHMVKGPAALALVYERSGDILMDAGTMPKYEWRIAGHILEM